MMATRSSKYPYQWPDGSYHSIPYTQHASNVKAAQRKATPSAGDALGMRSPLGVNAKLGTAGADNNRIETPAYATPAPLGAATPIAAPPVVTDPFLTPTDLANQAVELANVDGYLGQIHQQTEQAKIDATQKLGDIDTAEGRNLEAADWNTAARGVAQSSIRDVTKAGLSSDAQRSRTATQDTLGNQQNYENSEIQRADTVVRPAINTKYSEFAKANAQAASDANPGGGDAVQPTGVPDGYAGPVKGQAFDPNAFTYSAGNVAPGSAGYSGPTGLVGGQYIDQSGAGHAVQTVNGKKYYLGSTGKWVPIG